MTNTPSTDSCKAAGQFITRWRGVAASELSTSQSFVRELCDLLEVPSPHATPEQDYMFERPITFTHGDGKNSAGRIDCYRRGAFVLESKKIRADASTRTFDDALLRARNQGENYARALPASEGRPPFVVVVDVGNVIELYSEFTRSGGTYTPFPDPRRHRIALDDLRKESVRNFLRALWLDPMALDPARANAKVTRNVAVQLAAVARSLESMGHTPHDVAAFLTRCLFSMFAEDVGLLPRAPNGDGAFVDLLKRHREDPHNLQRMMAAMWADMDRGGFSAALASDVRRFNGKLFKNSTSVTYVLPLTNDQIDGLLIAASASWKEVEPSIFGTLLERALDPEERYALGAHYTPRAYVERLVFPTVVEPLRTEWNTAQATALLLGNEANALEGRKRDEKLREARDEVRRFHHRLCTVRVLDPACGSGNFLYVTLEHLKRLEGEVLNQLAALGDTQPRLLLAGETVTLQQLRGIEINERAAALAELVLWIGFLQWHIRTFGDTSIAEPVIHDYGNIESRDAVLAYDRTEPMRDHDGNLVTRWDGVTFKTHPTTGRPVPDEAAQVEQLRYINPRRATWPVADFVVGNPPFIGNKRMREALGDGYAEALREHSPGVPDTADFVMYWWDQAAELTREGKLRRFGLITTNSLRQTFNRQVTERHLDATPPLYLHYVIADHPWVDNVDGAAVRIAMSVGVAGRLGGDLLRVVAEAPQENGEVVVTLEGKRGAIHSDLTIGANVPRAKKLRANSGLCYQGFVLVGEGFELSDTERNLVETRAPRELVALRQWKNGRDLSQGNRGHFVIDLFPLSEDEARSQFPYLYQYLLDRVKPFRDQVARRGHRERWWIWGEARPGLRKATHGLTRIIVTNFAAKHRYFVFESPDTALDHNMYLIGTADALILGVLSSQVHLLWMLRAGSTLEDRPLWINSTCFLPFPFPSEDTGLTPALAERIRTLAEQLDVHRKGRQAANERTTLTGMYNALDKVRKNIPLSAQERLVYERDLVGVLRTLHDELDAAVLAAYGWSDLNLTADSEELLMRLMALNATRAAEEATGNVQWLRPEFQSAAAASGTQATFPIDEEAGPEVPTSEAPPTRHPWPIGIPDQIKAVADVLAATGQVLTADIIAAHFVGRGRWRERLPMILDALVAIGSARQVSDNQWSDARQ